jgi:hypothetical protein
MTTAVFNIPIRQFDEKSTSMAKVLLESRVAKSKSLELF